MDTKVSGHIVIYVRTLYFISMNLFIRKPSCSGVVLLLSPNIDPSQISHCNIKGLSVREFMRIENMITQVN